MTEVPFVNDRIIDLSSKAADLLGFEKARYWFSKSNNFTRTN